MKKKNKYLKDFLYNNLYNNHKVARMNHKASIILESLFDTYLKNPNLLAPSTRIKIKQYPLERVVCDYIAGMTDRFAQQEFNKLCTSRLPKQSTR